MRKVGGQQKNGEWVQLKLFTHTGEPDGKDIGGTNKIAGSGVEMTSRLKQQRILTENILERIVDYGNLNKAYQQVRGNQGIGGIDGMAVEELREWMGQHLNELQKQILQGQYKVDAVRKVEINKPTGGTRMLGIPTVKDRTIQQAIHQGLNRYYDPYFSGHSYGFRLGRSARQAIEQTSKFIAEGKEWVVDIDLEKFFDKINHDRLMQRLSKGIGDKRLLRLINAYLKAGIMTGGLMEQRIAGTPQGSPLSPLLSNIVLDELDKELEKRGLSFCRYADDCNIYVRSRKAGERILTSITKFIEKKLKLRVNRAKSGVRHCSEEKVIGELNLIIIGWTNYFNLANCWLANFRGLDGWLRRRLRCYRLKQCGRKYTIFKLLRSFDIPENTSWNIVMYSHGWWSMSNKKAVNEAMDLRWFNQIGLQSFQVRMSR